MMERSSDILQEISTEDLFTSESPKNLPRGTQTINHIDHPQRQVSDETSSGCVGPYRDRAVGDGRELGRQKKPFLSEKTLENLQPLESNERERLPEDSFNDKSMGRMHMPSFNDALQVGDEKSCGIEDPYRSRGVSSTEAELSATAPEELTRLGKNKIERMRKHSHAVAYQSLRELIPNITKTWILARQEILKEACNYITALKNMCDTRVEKNPNSLPTTSSTSSDEDEDKTFTTWNNGGSQQS